MGFRESVTVCIQDYWTFSGRARRPEYWWFALFVFAVSLLLSAIDAVIFGADTLMGFSGLFGLLTFLPQLAVSWRRMHDTGRPGWHVLLPYISAALFFGLAFVNPESTIYPSFSIGLVGAMLLSSIVVLVWLAMPSQAEPNRFGPEPPA